MHGHMSAKLSSLHKRLARLEQECAAKARHEELADCNCPGMKSAGSFLAPIFPEALEAELNKTCPVHGFRQLGRIVVMDSGTEESAKLWQLIPSSGSSLDCHCPGARLRGGRRRSSQDSYFCFPISRM